MHESWFANIYDSQQLYPIAYTSVLGIALESSAEEIMEFAYSEFYMILNNSI